MSKWDFNKTVSVDLCLHSASGMTTVERAVRREEHGKISAGIYEGVLVIAYGPEGDTHDEILLKAFMVCRSQRDKHRISGSPNDIPANIGALWEDYWKGGSFFYVSHGECTISGRSGILGPLTPEVRDAALEDLRQRLKSHASEQ